LGLLVLQNIPSVLVWFLVKVLVPLIISMVEISKKILLIRVGSFPVRKR
jgi:hypothetical protein